jgi:hypothetical protein
MDFCTKYDFFTGPLVGMCEFKWHSIDELVDLSKGDYAPWIQDG